MKNINVNTEPSKTGRSAAYRPFIRENKCTLNNEKANYIIYRKQSMLSNPIFFIFATISASRVMAFSSHSHLHDLAFQVRTGPTSVNLRHPSFAVRTQIQRHPRQQLNSNNNKSLRKWNTLTNLHAESIEQQESSLGSTEKSDSDEWNTLVASFKMYKAAYGDLKVPSRFVVPSIPPWPSKSSFYVVLTYY